jgi:hypothetical protein
LIADGELSADSNRAFVVLSSMKHLSFKIELCDLDLAHCCSIPSYLLRLLVTANVVRFEAFMVVTMKNAVFWDIKPQFILHRRHITSPLQSPAS